MHYDLVIIGGGLVGAGAALALQGSGLKIALVDNRLPSNEDPRLFALNTHSCQFLKYLNLWPKLAPHAAAIHQVHVSHQHHFGTVRLHNEDIGLPELGCVIPAYIIEAAINEQLHHIEQYRPAHLKVLAPKEKMELTIETESEERTITATLLIGADGTHSTVRKLVNVNTSLFDYEQSALVTRTRLSRPHHHIAYERFTSQGAIAMLPLNDPSLGSHCCATIWTADHAMIKQLMALSDHEFLNTLQQEFGYRLGRFQTTAKRHTYPLQKVKAEKPISKNVFLIGNAAHTLHPIAAQGFNLALFEVGLIVEAIQKHVKQKESLNSLDLTAISEQLKPFEKRSVNFSHLLSQLFLTKSVLRKKALQLGMMGLNYGAPLKKQFIKQMIGKRMRLL